jgi:5-methyltetrahydrofolate--homocysteine methyltransferase
VDPEALEAALAILPGRPLVNSVNGEEKCLAAILPIVKEHQVPVIGLVLDERGVPKDAETRTSIAGKLIERAAKFGIPAEDILIDPLVLAAGSDEDAGVVTLETIQMVRKAFDANLILGASNISFGLPDRRTLNQAFLALAIGKGATCAITDPTQMAPIIRAADLLLGRDRFARRYIAYWRTHKSKE